MALFKRMSERLRMRDLEQQRKREMKELKVVHPGLDDFLQIRDGPLVTQTCHKCIHPVSGDYYKCILEKGHCKYYLHKECAELQYLPHDHHPLHPQHPIILRYDETEFGCSFCGETNQSRGFYQCSHDQCDFFLHSDCHSGFIYKPELFGKIEHFYHFRKDHRLSPYKFTMLTTEQSISETL